MRTLSPAVVAAFASSNVVLVQLIHMAFTTGAIALNTSNWDLEFAGVTYKGAYGLGSVSATVDKPGEVQGLQLDLAGGSAASVSLALDDSDVVQGTLLTIRTAVLDAATYAILDAPIDWIGRLDTMSIVEDGTQAAVRVTAESAAVDLLRGSVKNYTDGDQQQISAGDRAFEYVVDQADKQIVWPAREYFLK